MDLKDIADRLDNLAAMATDAKAWNLVNGIMALRAEVLNSIAQIDSTPGEDNLAKIIGEE